MGGSSLTDTSPPSSALFSQHSIEYPNFGFEILSRDPSSYVRLGRL